LVQILFNIVHPGRVLCPAEADTKDIEMSKNIFGVFC